MLNKKIKHKVRVRLTCIAVKVYNFIWKGKSSAFIWIKYILTPKECQQPAGWWCLSRILIAGILE